jgi:hypothetical protein
LYDTLVCGGLREAGCFKERFGSSRLLDKDIKRELTIDSFDSPHIVRDGYGGLDDGFGRLKTKPKL